MQEMLWFNGFTPTRQSRISEVLSQFVWGLRSVAELKRLQNMIKQGTYKSNTFNKRKQQQEQTFVWDLWAWKFKRKKNMELGSQIQCNFGIGLLPICLETSVLLIDGRFYFRYGPITEVILIHWSQWERQKVGVISTYKCLMIYIHL